VSISLATSGCPAARGATPASPQCGALQLAPIAAIFFFDITCT